MCVCSLSYPVCKVHAPFIYCHLWPRRFCYIFPHCLINGTIFGKMLLDMKCVFLFSLHLSETFLILRRIQQRAIINAHMS